MVPFDLALPRIDVGESDSRIGGMTLEGVVQIATASAGRCARRAHITAVILGAVVMVITDVRTLQGFLFPLLRLRRAILLLLPVILGARRHAGWPAPAPRWK